MSIYLEMFSRFLDLRTSKYDVKAKVNWLELEPYSTMVREKFMSETPRNVVNCQESDFLPGRDQKVQILT